MTTLIHTVRLFCITLFFFILSSCAQQSNIMFETKIDEFARSKYPIYYKERFDVYKEYEDYLIENNIIKDIDNKSYFEFVERISKSSNVEYPNDYQLEALLSSLLEKHNPSGNDFTEEERMFLENNDIRKSKSYLFEQSLETINNKRDIASLYLKYFDVSDLDCFFIKSQLLDLINSGFKINDDGIIERSW